MNKNDSNNNVFISYHHSYKEIAEKIERNFTINKVSVKRDEKDLDNGDSIEKFMKEISISKYVVLLINKEYFTSLNCMYEAILAYTSNVVQLLCPVVMEENIYDVEFRNNILRHWKNCKLPESEYDRRKVEKVKNNVVNFLDFIEDKKNLKEDEIHILLKMIGKKNMVEVLTVNTEYDDLINDLKISTGVRIVEYSIYSDKEKLKYCSYKTVVTETGVDFIFTMQNRKGIEREIQIPKVIKIEKGNEGSNFSKYYFKCFNRERQLQKQELKCIGEKKSEEIDIYDIFGMTIFYE